MAMRGWRWSGLIVAAAGVFLSAAAAAAPGDADPAFGTSGRVLLNLGHTFTNDYARAVAVQADGKIVAGGAKSSSSFPSVMRLNADGSIDTEFANLGKFSMTDLPFGGSIYALTLDGDKIVAVGRSGYGSNQDEFLMFRLNANGSLDTSFGAGTGRVVVDLGGEDFARAVTVSGGKIIVAGNAGSGGGDFGIVRLNSNGTLDTSFAGTGKLMVDFSGNVADAATGIAVDASGRIVVGGNSLSGGNNRFAALRLNDNGSLDTSFGLAGTGKVTVDVAPGGSSYANGLALDGDKIVLGGGANSSGNAGFAAARLNDNGTPDGSFGGTGMVVVDFDPATADEALAIGIDGSGIVLGGYSLASGNPDFALVRLSTSGVLDAGFGGTGKLTFELLGGASDVGHGLAVSGGKVIQVGQSGFQLGFVQVNGNGSPDTSFGSGTGMLRIEFGFDTNDSGVGIALLEGKIYAVGKPEVSGSAAAVVRLNADGSKDSAFGGEGQVLYAGDRPSAAVGDGAKLYVTGTRAPGCLCAANWYVTRSNADGSLDETFAGTGRALISVPASGNPNAIAIANGKVVIAGNEGLANVRVVRLNSSGIPDGPFGGSSVVVNLNTLLSSNSRSANAVAMDASGRVYVAGMANDGATGDNLFVLRFTDAGVLDASFGSGGAVLLDVLPGSTDAASRIVLDGSRILVGANVSGNMAVLRLLDNGSLDLGFGDGGKVTFDFGSATPDSLADLVLEPSGKLLLVGSTTYEGASGVALIKLNPDGTLDQGFGPLGGKAFHGQFPGGSVGSRAALRSGAATSIVGTTGNAGQSSEQNVFVLSVLTTVPEAPGAPDLLAAQDSGVSNSDDVTNVLLPSFSGSCTDGEMVQLLIDGNAAGSPAACAGGYAVALSNPVVPGIRSVQAVAINAAGSGPASAALQVLFDVTLPETSLGSVPFPVTNATTANVGFTSNEIGAAFECRFDGAAFASCPSPAQKPDLADGPHSFDVRAIDAAGNIDPTPATWTWTVDTVVPTVSLLTAPSSPSGTSVSFTFSSNDGSASFLCSTGTSIPASCDSPKIYTGLAPGTYSFAVRAVDSAMNESAPAMHEWTVGTARGDFTGDGKADVLWRNAATGENYLYPMNGTAILGTEGYARTVADPDWRVAKIGDFDGDGKADILWRNGASGENYVYLMNGTTIAGEGYIRTVASQDWQVAGVGDFNGDGKDDILWRNASSGENYVYPMNGLSILGTEGYLRTVALAWTVAGIGDMDGDAKADVFWRNTSTGENYAYFMDGTTIKPTEGYVRPVASQSWQVAGMGDYNGDGKDDVLWRNSATGESYLYPMSGTTILGTEGYIRTVADTAWQVKGTGDYDGDGKADVLWRNAVTGENYLYPMDGTTIKPTEGYLRTVPPPHWRIVSSP
jgi:uncharacterized delta-60 repeat protein